MSWVEEDRWSCACGTTVVAEGSPAEIAVTLAAAMRDHGKRHETARVLAMREKAFRAFRRRTAA